MLNSCCCCIPLALGCLLLAILYIVIQVFTLINYYMLITSFENEDNEDEENIKQKEAVKEAHIFRSIGVIIQIVLGLIMILATLQKIPPLLKACAIAVIGIDLIKFIALMLGTPNATNILWIFQNMLPLLLAFYVGIILWSYAVQIEEEGPSYIVYNSNTSSDGPVYVGEQHRY